MSLPGPMVWTLLLPLLGACLILFIPKHRTAWIKNTALSATAGSLALVGYAFLRFDPEGNGYQWVNRYDWIPSFGISFHVGVDGISLVLALLTAICSFSGVFVARSVPERIKEYMIFYLFLITGCFGVLLSLNVFFMYFFYEMAVIPVFPLIGAWGSGNREYASMKLTLYLTLGAVLALLGILALYWATGLDTFNFVVLENVLAVNPLPVGFQKWFFPTILLGFGVIVTLWPFHTWSPVGYAAAPTSVSMLHAGVLKKLGAYLILRIGITLMPEGAKIWMPYVAWIAAVNIVYCGLVAFKQKDLKFLLGYSSCSHMGFILLGLSCLDPLALSGTVFFMFAHGVMAALGFALVGTLYEQVHTRDLENWGGLAKKVPFLSTAFVMTALASSGVPGFANFVGEVLIAIGAWDYYRLPTVLGLSGLLITAGYMLKIVRWGFEGSLNPRCATARDAVALQKIPYVLMIGALLVTGLFPSTLLERTDPATKGVLRGIQSTFKIQIKQEFFHDEI